MPNIVPVSDLRNYNEVLKNCAIGEPVFLTKNGYGAMVVLSLEEYSRLTDQVELALDKADKLAKESTARMSHEEVFGSLRRKVNAR